MRLALRVNFALCANNSHIFHIWVSEDRLISKKNLLLRWIIFDNLSKHRNNECLFRVTQVLTSIPLGFLQFVHQVEKGDFLL